jgi:hypothetical protein
MRHEHNTICVRFPGIKILIFPAETGQAATNMFPCRAALLIKLAKILTLVCRTLCILEKTKPKVVHITLCCDNALPAC